MASTLGKSNGIPVSSLIRVPRDSFDRTDSERRGCRFIQTIPAEILSVKSPESKSRCSVGVKTSALARLSGPSLATGLIWATSRALPSREAGILAVESPVTAHR